MRCKNCIHYDVCYQYDIIGEDDSEMCALYEQKRPHGEWIPICVSVPEKDGRYIVSLPDRGGTIMCADYLGGKWYPDDYECTSNHVIAWMPLPEPYKKEGEAE